jgi:hypothetical protein
MITVYNELLYFAVSRVLFGNVLGLAKERVRMWLSVVSLWPLVFCFGHKVRNLDQFSDRERIWLAVPIP